MSAPLNALEIDYSAIPSDVVTPASNWRPPRHVFFGKKQEDGMMEEEPKYVHQPYPAFRYKQIDQKIRAGLAKNAEEDARLKEDGWKDTPAAFGYIGAPDFDTAVKMRAQAEERAKPAAPLTPKAAVPNVQAVPVGTASEPASETPPEVAAQPKQTLGLPGKKPI